MCNFVYMTPHVGHPAFCENSHLEHSWDIVENSHLEHSCGNSCVCLLTGSQVTACFQAASAYTAALYHLERCAALKKVLSVHDERLHSHDLCNATC